MIAYGRGSQFLAGAASLKYRMPAVGDCFPLVHIAHTVELQPDKLPVAGSTPALQLTQ